jgi:hypothetical protein
VGLGIKSKVILVSSERGIEHVLAVQLTFDILMRCTEDVDAILSNETVQLSEVLLVFGIPKEVRDWLRAVSQQLTLKRVIPGVLLEA